MDSSQSRPRFKVDLSRIYNDHRKSATIFVKKEFKTVGDLKDHISYLFGIKHFFLSLEPNHFLPDLEDIGVLTPNEEICVIPLNENSLKSQKDPSLKNCVEKKSSKKRMLPLNTVEEESDSKKTKKPKKHSKTKDPQVIRLFGEYEYESPPLDSVEKVEMHFTKTKKLSPSKQVSESAKAKVSTPAHTDTNSTSVRLSRRNDTPTIKQYIPPKPNTDKYLSKAKVNIVKIDIIHRKPEKVPGPDFNITEDRVKKAVEYFEKVASPDSNKPIEESETPTKDEENTDISQTEASNYTKIYLSQKDANSAFASQPESDAEIIEIESSVTDLSSTSANKKDTGVSLKSDEKKAIVTSSCKNKEHQKTENKNGTPVCQRQSSEIASERNSTVVKSDNNNSEVNKTPITHSSKSFVGVGHLLGQLKESDSQNDENDLAISNNIKRKRVRKRRKVNHNKSNCNDASSEINSPQNSYQFQTPITPVLNTSNSHLRFEDRGNAESVVQEPILISDSSSISEVFTGGTIIKSTPIMKAAIITGDDNEKVILENKSFFSLEMIQKSPLMTGKLDPKIGDFVAFKILILSENGTPQPSDYIIGEVLEYLVPSKIVRFKITRGIEELCKDEVFLDESNTKQGQETKNIKEVSWERILEARLLYP